ncbi:hemocytin [Hyposmocoma kahamanoa]|uniref:hemocytin n=1 Tax=Hyposmocoma kahamanoa TaxID=1477025 RepID=UPI000E6D6953|nr:hemocytin [Hyposmocoma kahamanoa]
MLILQLLILLFGVYFANAGYGAAPAASSQPYVEAPSYVPAYSRNKQVNRYSYTKSNSYTKTGYNGQQNGYAGTKNGYAGTKNGSPGAGYGGGSYTSYGERPGTGIEQSDVQAPSYVPAYAQNHQVNSYSGTNSNTFRQQNGYTGYTGTKTGYTGTKTGYTGTKTRYTGTKTGYAGTKTGYTGTKTGYTGNGYGGDTYTSYSQSPGNGIEPFLPEASFANCNPQCINNGICVGKDKCKCPSNFYGNICEFEKKACPFHPPLPMNSALKCSDYYCTISCKDGHKFPDGSSILNMQCIEGSWQSVSDPLMNALSDCSPECNPPCLNGGFCLSVNACQCPTDYRGPQCQYAASVCDMRKLVFNGAYKCKGDGERYNCVLTCPPGSTPTSTLADVYTCTYDTGVFQPQPVPNCVYDYEKVVIQPHNHVTSFSHSGTSYSYYNSSSGTQTGGSGTMTLLQNVTPKGGECMATPGVSSYTFDNRYYSYHSTCPHILVRDARDRTYSVIVQRGVCPEKVHCPGAKLIVFLEDIRYAFKVGDDGSVAFRSRRGAIPIPASLPGIRVSKSGGFINIDFDAQGVAVRWNALANFVTVSVTARQWNTTEGLCGTLNGDPNDDFTTTPNVFASSWQFNEIGEVCTNDYTERNTSVKVKKEALKFCTTLLNKEKFRKCSNFVDASMFLETCQLDYADCLSDPEDCACKTVSLYASECLRHGVNEMVTWRDDDTCPVVCPDSKVYKCGTESQPSCASPLASTKPEGSICVEGCYCPEGLLLEESRCVSKEECHCRLRNKSFKPGEKVRQDCNECTCEAGQWKCSTTACRARCSSIGDPHYTTFDGLKYDFMGHCTYTLMTGDNITIDVENVACSGAVSEAMNLTPYKGEGKPSCTKAVTINYGAVSLHLKQGGYILINGQEVTTLPAVVGDIKIRAASSLFLTVQLPNKVDIWWDTVTRVIIDVPPEFKGKTKGLCGTFNMNQKDDFLTPEGDTEQSVYAFANKWKTREFCDDISTIEPVHPCTAYVQNKEAAEKYCSKLKSNLFKSCHWYVDVEAYYTSCLYDVCACDGDVSRCFCPWLGEYAMACAQSGVNIQWRYNVKECELSCNGGQEYTVCADSCLRTCTDRAVSNSDCKPSCVEGCACPPGQLLDTNNVCVPEAQCPCFHKGLQFNAGYKETRPGKRERELCTCVGAHWECQPASPTDLVQYPPAEDLNNCSAAKHMEFTTCNAAAPLTCKNMHLPVTPTATECRVGCRCMKGYVLDVTGNKCVRPQDCPCHHGGTSYPDGHVMQEDCNTCECKSGKWECSKRACAAVCSAWGDSHVTTFDGANYDFEGVCTYLLVKGARDVNDGFSVEIQNVPCGTTGATCSKAVTLKVGEEAVTLTKDVPIPNLSTIKRIKLREAGSFVFLDVPSLSMSMQWDRGMRVYVKVDPNWQGRVAGLCGNYNSDMRDDFQGPTGGIPESSALLFVDSWKMKDTCPKPTEVTDHCKERPHRKAWASAICGALKRYPFNLCQSEVPPNGYIERCERDACACDSGDDCECTCNALAAYAQHCANRGVVIKWRNNDLCPMQCDEDSWHYDSCVSACPMETCDNTLYYPEIKTLCQYDACVEGCKPKVTCPEGFVYKDANFTDCVPRTTCRSICMTLPDGKEILEGEVVEEDDCHTCHCFKKQKICSGKPCATTHPTVELLYTTPPPLGNNQLKCLSGWTPWISRSNPKPESKGQSIVKEPLPEMNELQIGEPMCDSGMMKKIECRTIKDHKDAKETGLNVECSLERGLVCEGPGDLCPYFEIRVFCDCGEFQCLDSVHPNHPHPTDCSKFYECTPDLMNPDKPHTVLKSCGVGTLYNPVTMICDFPSAVLAVRPECGTRIETLLPPEDRSPKCPPGQVYSDCAYPCGKLCHHFKKTLFEKGECTIDQDCVKGCIDESVAQITCDFESLWRDEKTCVPKRDCTCYSNGKVVKPGGTVSDGCLKCQCLNDELHCDTSACNTVPPTARLQSTTETPHTFFATETTHTFFTTSSPPPECAPDGYINLLWGDQPLPETSFNASSQYSDSFKPQYAKLDANTDQNGGSWAPAPDDVHPYFKVTLPRREPIYGVIIQGSPLFDQYITSYNIMYGDDDFTMSTLNGPDDKPKVFRGPVNSRTHMKQMLEPPIEAKVVKINPLTWNQEPALRLEIIGCREVTETPTTTAQPLQCTDIIGLEAGLPVENIEVSSHNELRQQLALGSDEGWRPLYSTPGEWIMFDFTSPRNITGVKTKGGTRGWVNTYKIMYTSDLSNFNPVIDSSGAPKEFPGNFDKTTEVMNEFRPPIHARYFKVLPLKWNGNIEMKIEPIGCFMPYPISTTIQPPLSTPGICKKCPGVATETCDCNSVTGKYFDGERCVTRDECPCIHNSMPYPVGATFRGTNCDDCVCKLGGISDCKPIKECKCASDLVPKLVTATCECVCTPCPENTRICPTSKICLPLERWCDGLQDCSDDEQDCTSTTTATPFTTPPAVTTTVEPTQTSVKTYTNNVVATTFTPVTTPKPSECPKEECAPGYLLVYTNSATSISGNELPPPRPRYSYSRYGPRNGGYTGTKSVYTKSVYSKGGYSGSKGGSGYGTVTPTPSTNQAFTVVKPTLTNTISSTEPQCRKFKCVPPPPSPYKPPTPCRPPACPPYYTLKPDTTPVAIGECPQYLCVPPSEQIAYCNVTGRTINSFDGSGYKLDLCFHMLARENRFNAWSIFLHKICTPNGCHNELILMQDTELIIVKPNLSIMYNGYLYNIDQMSMICFQKNMFDVVKIGNGLAIKSRKHNFVVFYTDDGDVKIGISKNYVGAVDGICGAFDGNPANDRRLPDGRLVPTLDEFAQGWAKPGMSPNACAPPPPRDKPKVWELCDVITKEPFTRCAKVLDLKNWRNICAEKVFECSELVTNGTKKSLAECKCLVLDRLVAECLAGDKNVDLAGWRIDTNCLMECKPPLVQYDCYRKRCEPTCSSLGESKTGRMGIKDCPSEDGVCFPGCYCPEGTLREGDACVAPSKCFDCSCRTTGTSSNVMSFEGDVLPVHGNCSYVVSSSRKFLVAVTYHPCKKNNSTCTKALYFMAYSGSGDRNAQVIKDDAANKLLVLVNQKPVFSDVSEDWITVKWHSDDEVTISLTQVHLEVTISASNMDWSLRVPSHLYAQNTRGLCGVCASENEHLVTRNGTVTDDFLEYGKSWQATPEELVKLKVQEPEMCQNDFPAPPPECKTPPAEANPCNNLLNTDKFGKCHALIDPHSYVQACEEEMCAHNSTNVLCETLERYAAVCRQVSVCLDWRDGLCPHNCEAPFVYNKCVDCELSCDNYEEMAANSKACSRPLKEGCFCPPGKVRLNNTCIEPTKCFPCDADKEHFAGDEWKKDACTTCKCSKVSGGNTTQISCTTQVCATTVCAENEDLHTKPIKPGDCCPQYLCVPKSIQKNCVEPKKMECSFGQVLKQKTNSIGCTEYACECKPPSECEPIPGQDEVEILDPGLERVIDDSGCCPRVIVECHKDKCPKAIECPQFHTRLTKANDACCPKYDCEVPKDKCIVQLEWEAAPKGGERPRDVREILLKDKPE